MVQAIVHAFQSVPPTVWVLLGTALGVSTVQQNVKNLLERKVESLSQGANVSLLVTFSALASAADQLVNSANLNPGLFGLHTAVIVGVTHVIYTFVVKPALGIMSDAKAHRALSQPATTATAAPLAPVAGDPGF